MNLRVRGPEGQATLRVEPDWSVAAFRTLLAEKTGVPAERQEVGEQELWGDGGEVLRLLRVAYV